MTLWTLAFWRAAAERSIKTLAQTAAALIVADGTGLLDTDWLTVTSVAGMAAVVSLLVSLIYYQGFHWSETLWVVADALKSAGASYAGCRPSPSM